MNLPTWETGMYEPCPTARYESSKWFAQNPGTRPGPPQTRAQGRTPGDPPRYLVLNAPPDDDLAHERARLLSLLAARPAPAAPEPIPPERRDPAQSWTEPTPDDVQPPRALVRTHAMPSPYSTSARRAPSTAPAPEHLLYDSAAERSILGHVLYTPDDIASLDALRPDHFHSEGYRRIYEAMGEIVAAGSAISNETLLAHLRESDRLAQVGGAEAITDLNACAVLGPKQLAAHAEIVIGHWRSRRLAEMGDHLASEARAGYAPDVIADGAIASLEALSALGPTTASYWPSLIVTPTSDWYETAPPKREWLLRDSRDPQCRGVLPLGKVGQLIAEGGAGKTLVLCQIATAVATGTRWLDTFEAAIGRVLLVLGEEDAEEARRRLYHAARSGQGVQPEPGTIEVLPLAGVQCAMLERDACNNTIETPFLKQLRKHIQAGGFRLVAVDPLSRFAGPDAETDNAAATRFIQALESLAAPDRTILNAHHTNKPSRGAGAALDGSSGRGSSAFVDGARWQCALSVERLKLDDHERQLRIGEVVTLTVTKSNYAAKPDPLQLRRDLDHGGSLAPLDEADTATVQEARGGTAGRAVKTAQREGERDQVLADRERKKADRRVAGVAKSEADLAKQIAADDACAIALRSEHPPGTPERQLIALQKKARLCGGTRAHSALVRTRGVT